MSATRVLLPGVEPAQKLPTADEILTKPSRSWTTEECVLVQRAYQRGGLRNGLHSVLSDVLWQERAAREGQAIARRIFEARASGPTLALTEDELAAYVATGIELLGCRHAQPVDGAAERQLQNDLQTEY